MGYGRRHKSRAGKHHLPRLATATVHSWTYFSNPLVMVAMPSLLIIYPSNPSRLSMKRMPSMPMAKAAVANRSAS